MYTLAAFYKFTPLPDFTHHREPLLEVARERGVVGSILLAHEGVNGTICGDRDGVEAVLAALRALPGCADLEAKFSHAPAPGFKRMKVRLKKEIVTMGVEGVDARAPGDYVAPADWNALIAREDVVVIDARNDYEVEIGTFEGAINPGTEAFGAFPDWLKRYREETGARKVAMFCTGGIRCEKATAYARSIGFDEVYHLKGGILKYLEETPEEASRWQGDCYVFDERVSVRHGLEPGDYVMCRACGRPVSREGRAHQDYVEGVSCAACYGDYSDARKATFAARQRRYDQADEG